MPNVTESDVIAGVWIVEPTIHGDQRGLFIETYRREWFPNGREMVQGNRANRQRARWSGCTTTCTRPTTGTCRSARPGSCCTTCARAAPPTARRSALDLTGDNHMGVFIPPGVAHGFAALTDMVITYLVDGYYNPADELGVAWNDPAIGADWGVDRADPVRRATRPTRSRADLPGGSPPVLADEDAHMKLFVTGAAGFIGSNYVRHVLATTDDDGHGLRRAHLRRQPRQHPRRRRRPALSVRARRHLRPGRRARRRWRVTTPSCTSPPRRHVDRSIKDGYSFVRTNCFGTNVLCDVARQVGVERFLHISTDEVYGSIDEGSFSETDALGPRSPYSAAKAGSDLIALSATSPRTGCRCSSRAAATTSGRTSSPRRSSRCSPPTCSTARRCRCTATAATCATGSTSHDHNTAADLVLRTGRRRRDLQHRRRQRDHQQRAHPPAARADRSRRELHRRPSPTGSATTVATRSPTTRSARSAGRPSTTSIDGAGRDRRRGTATTARGGSR